MGDFTRDILSDFKGYRIRSHMIDHMRTNKTSSIKMNIDFFNTEIEGSI